MKFKHYILAPDLDEAAYMGNIGFEELVKYYQTASKKDIIRIDEIIERGDWDEFKKQIKPTKIDETVIWGECEYCNATISTYFREYKIEVREFEE